MNEIELYEKAIKKWGKKAQTLMVLEEMSELSLLLFHSLRDNREVDNWQIAEEVADVEIMLDQLKLIFDFSKEVDKFKVSKLKRLELRLEIPLECKNCDYDYFEDCIEGCCKIKASKVD